jgi:hypothetical protein
VNRYAVAVFSYFRPGEKEMPTLQLIGRLLPQAIQVSTSVVPVISWTDPQTGISERFTIQIQNSVLYVNCHLSRFEKSELGKIFSRARDFARVSVDLISFSTGRPLSLTFETLIDPDGRLSAPIAEEKTLPPLCTSYSLQDASYPQVLQLVASSPPLFMALNDLIVAITVSGQSAINCARAIEGLRNMMVTPQTSRKDAWSIFRQNLHVEEAYLTLITDTSTGPRHGDRTSVPGTTLAEILRRSWILMNRFIEYEKRGSKPLPEVEFPLLQ